MLRAATKARGSQKGRVWGEVVKLKQNSRDLSVHTHTFIRSFSSGGSFASIARLISVEW